MYFLFLTICSKYLFNTHVRVGSSCSLLVCHAMNKWVRDNFSLNRECYILKTLKGAHFHGPGFNSEAQHRPRVTSRVSVSSVGKDYLIFLRTLRMPSLLYLEFSLLISVFSWRQHLIYLFVPTYSFYLWFVISVAASHGIFLTFLLVRITNLVLLAFMLCCACSSVELQS